MLIRICERAAAAAGRPENFAQGEARMGGMERTRPARGSGCGNTTSHCQVLRDSRTERPTATAPHPFITPLPLL